MTDPLGPRRARPPADSSRLSGVFGPVRAFTIAGHEWIAFEFIDNVQDPPRRNLIFETMGLMRRLRNYPADWRALSDAKLFELCEGCDLPVRREGTG